jgi:hypothetical protein
MKLICRFKIDLLGLFLPLMCLTPCWADESPGYPVTLAWDASPPQIKLVTSLTSCPVTLAWDASPDASVTGYALYYGLAASHATNRVDVGLERMVTLTNLLAFSNYFFYAVSYNSLGMESVPSDWLYYRPPAITRLRIAKTDDDGTVLRFRTSAGALCRIEYCTSLEASQWQTLATTNADAAGDIVVGDLDAESHTNRFYRAVLVVPRFR